MLVEYIPEVLVIIAIMAIGLSISIGIISYINYVYKLAYNEGIIWTNPVKYGNYWLIQVSILQPNPIKPPLHPGYPRGLAWGWGVRKHTQFLVLKNMKFVTITGIEPGYALECGNYTIMSVYAEYCIFIVKAYPIMPLGLLK